MFCLPVRSIPMETGEPGSGLPHLPCAPSGSARVIYQYEKIEDYVRHVFPVFYFTRCFILGKYDRSCVNNVPVNNELDVSVMLIWLPHYERMRQVIDRYSLIRFSITCK